MNTKYHVELVSNQQPRIQLSKPERLSRCVEVRDITVRGYVGAGYSFSDEVTYRKLHDVTLLSKGHETVAIRIVEDTSEQDAIEAQKARWLARNAGHAEAVSDTSINVDATPTEGLFVDELADDFAAETVGV